MGLSASPSPALRLELLGRFRLSVDGRSADDHISMRGRELLALLALQAGDRMLRERIATRVWPDTSEGQARTNLRRELHQLRHDVPGSDILLDASGAQLGLRISDTSCDLYELRQALRRAAEAHRHERGADELAALSEAARIFAGDLLPECFAEWLGVERDRLHQDVVEGLRRLTSLLEDRGDIVEAVRWARRLTELDPFDEIAYRAQMRLHARAGDRAAALHAYHRCAHGLERELGTTPSAETQALYRTLLDETPVAPTQAEVRPRIPTRQSPETWTFVGRGAEQERILTAWRQRDPVRVVSIVGEPGIGKSRLADEVARITENEGAEVVRARAYAMEGQLDYGPVADWLRSPVVLARIHDLEPMWRTELGRLLPELLPARTPTPSDQPLSASDVVLRGRLFDAMSRAVLGGANPVVLVLDDLQWCDAETLAVVHYLSRRPAQAPLLVVATARTNELADNLAAERLLLDLRQDGRLLEIELGPLAASEVQALLERASGASLPAEASARIYDLSEGNPLFALEALRADLHVTTPSDDLAPMPSASGGLISRSPRVRGVLAARLAQLDPRARDLAECAATIGRAFDADVLGQAADLDEQDRVVAIDELWRRRLVREQSNLRYDFSHDAIREAVLLSLSPARARLLHRRVAQALELVRATNLDEMSASLASHYELAGIADRAVTYYERAARTAASVYAHGRAIALVDRALELVARQPESRERDRNELQLLFTKAPSLRATYGYADSRILSVLGRARAIAERLEDPSLLFLTLRSFWASLFVSGDLQETHTIADQLRDLSRVLPDMEAESHHAIAGALTNRGDFAPAIEAFEAARRGYDPAAEHRRVSVFGSDLWVFNCAWESHALWLFGLEDRAVASAADAVRTAKAIRHAYSEALAQAYSAVLHYMRRDEAACIEAADAAREVCDRHGFAYYRHWGTLLGAWARRHDDADAAVRIIRASLESLDQEHAWARRSIYLAALAEALMVAGRKDEAATALDQAEERSRSSGERLWDAELSRLRAELEPEGGHAERALEVAQKMRARSLALRSALTLARIHGVNKRTRELVRKALAALPEGGRSQDRTAALELLESA